jgi:hypothetical protein
MRTAQQIVRTLSRKSSLLRSSKNIVIRNSFVGRVDHAHFIQYSTSNETNTCWKCEQPVRNQNIFCASCGKIQPPNKESNYFKVLDA